MTDLPAKSTVTSLKRYLTALAFTKALIFWYAIEKVFYADAGISLNQIIIIGAVAQGAKVIFELPTSVIADRWSRRKMLILSNLAMIICCIFLGLGSSLIIFVIGVLWWALNDALLSGVYEAFTYDSLAAHNYKHRFKKVYGRMVSIENTTFAVAGIIAGLLTTWSGFRVNFYITILPMIVSSLILLKMPEPQIRRTVEDDMTWLKHVDGAFEIMRRLDLRWPVALFISFIALRGVWYEYYQLVGIDLKMTAFLFGALFSIILVGMALSAELARRLPASRAVVGVIWIVLILTHLIGLRVANVWFAVLNLVLLYMGLRSLQFYLELYIQNHITSERRATVLSLASTVGYACFFVLVGIFSLAANRFGTRWALTITSLPFLLMAIVDLGRRIPWADPKIMTAEVVDGQSD